MKFDLVFSPKMVIFVAESDEKGPKRLHLVKLVNKGLNFFQKYFGHGRNRARSHDKIFFVISNPALFLSHMI